jgi:hypothetical protein
LFSCSPFSVSTATSIGLVFKLTGNYQGIFYFFDIR